MFLRPLFTAALLICLAQPCLGQYYTLRFLSDSGYPRDIQAITFSPDGGLLAVSVEYDGLILIDPASGDIVREHDVTPFRLAFSADGMTLLAISNRATRLFSVQAGHSVEANWRLPDGKIGLSLDRKNGKLLITEVGRGGPADRTDQIHVGDELVGVRRQGREIELLGRTRGAALEALSAPADTRLVLQIVPHGQREPQEVPVKVTRLETVNGRLQYVFDSRTVVGRPVASCVSEGLQVFIDAATANVNSAIDTAHVGALGQRCISPDGKRFAMLGSWFKEHDSPYGIELIDLAAQETISTYPFPSETYDEMMFGPDGRKLYIASFDRLRVFDLDEEQYQKPLFFSWRPPSDEEIAKEKAKIESTSALGRAVYQQARDYVGYSRSEKSAPMKLVECFDVSSTGLVAIGGVDADVSIWNLDGSGKVAQLEPKDEDGESVEHVQFSPDGQWLTYYIDGTLTIQAVDDVVQSEAKDTAPKGSAASDD